MFEERCIVVVVIEASFFASVYDYEAAAAAS